jgi:hypothetical protein
VGSDKFTNTKQQVEDGMLAAFPPPADFGKLKGYGSVTAIEDALHTVFRGKTGDVPAAQGWQNVIPNNKLVPGESEDGVVTFLTKLPAIVRASIAVAFATLNPKDGSLVNYINNNVSNRALKSQSRNALKNGDPKAAGLEQFEQATVKSIILAAVGMDLGIKVGFVNGLIDTVVDLATLAYKLVTDTTNTWNAIVSGVEELLTLLGNGEFAAAAKKVFPEIAAEIDKAVTLYDKSELVSFDGGFAVGKIIGNVLSQVAVQVAGAYFTGGALNVVKTATSYLAKAVVAAGKLAGKALTIAVKASAKLATPVLSATRALVRPAATVARGTTSLLRATVNSPVGQALANRVRSLFAPSLRIADGIRKFCFTPDTLVSTARGLRRIGDLCHGDQIHAYDFATGKWVQTDVVDRHDSPFHGEIIAVHVGDSVIEGTINHPFWVIEGEGLKERARPADLDAGENESLSLPGRWINSQDLCPGDMVYCQDRRTRRVARVERRPVEGEPVCNLSIREYHNFAVGEARVLVHNAFCTYLTQKGIAIPQALVNYAKKFGVALHGHHIVQKVEPLLYKTIKTVERGANAAWQALGVEERAAWYVGKARQILKDLQIPIIETEADAAALVKAGKSLDNLCWAINGEATHTLPVKYAVWARLEDAAAKGATLAQKQTAVLKALKDMATIFGDAGLPWWPGTP